MPFLDTELELREDYTEYLEDLGPLKHVPLHGPRADHVGEQVYSFEWMTINDTAIQGDDDPPNVFLATVLHNMDDRVTQRHASVAASFITWLGTACGRAYLEQGSKLTNDTRYSGNGYLAAWAMENRRWPSVNRGMRTIEAVLMTADDYAQDMLSNTFWGMRRRAAITVDDLETIDHVAIWLGSQSGQAFIHRCEYLIRIREKFPDPMTTVRVIAGVIDK